MRVAFGVVAIAIACAHPPPSRGAGATLRPVAATSTEQEEARESRPHEVVPAAVVEPELEPEPEPEPEPTSPAARTTASLSPSEIATIKQAMIDASIADYVGNCPCPYHSMKNGRRCGKTSAHSRAGGEAPLCFPEDISTEMLDVFLTENGGTP